MSKDFNMGDFATNQVLTISKAGAYDALSQNYGKLQEENEKIKRLLHELTPGGSEFYNDPEYCAKWIRENREENHYALAKIIKDTKEENKLLKERVKYLEDMIKEYSDKIKGSEVNI